MRKPRVLVLADTPGWAWGRKARAYERHLSDEFAVTVAYYAAVPPFVGYDLLHLMEFPQLRLLAPYADLADNGRLPFKVISGCTAHVWPTWGVEQMRTWATLCDAWHANSLMLQAELQQFHRRVYYTPNGVDTEFWTPSPTARIGPRPLIAAHVGKPNRRKGAHLIIEAARRAGVELRVIQRTSQSAHDAEHMREFYRGVDVLVTASNMDGTPNPALEAASCGCALISTPIGNMPEFIHRGCGFLLEPRWPYFEAPTGERGIYGQWTGPVAEQLTEAIAERLVYLAAHVDEARIMGSVARIRAHEWGWLYQVERVRTLWREVLG